VVEKHPPLQLIFFWLRTLRSLKEKIKALDESRVRLIPNQENIFPILSQAKKSWW